MLSDRKQLDMFDAATRPSPAVEPPPPPRTTELDVAFETFLVSNPHVMPAMLSLARAKLAAGYKRIGAKALWEDLREHLRAHKLGQWKLNNSFTALAARRLIELEPALAGVIEVRRRKP